MAFFDIFTRMDETLAEQSHTETFGSGLKRFGIFLALLGLLAGLGGGAITLLAGKTTEAILVFFGVLIGIVVVGLVASLLFNALLWLCAKLLGGRGEFGQQYGVMTLPLWPGLVIGIAIMAMYIVAILLMAIPIIGWIVGLLLIVLAYFGYLVLINLQFYFYIVFVKAVHDLSTFRSAVALSIAMLVVVAIIMAIYLVLIFAFIGLAGPSSLPKTPTGFTPFSG